MSHTKNKLKQEELKKIQEELERKKRRIRLRGIIGGLIVTAAFFYVLLTEFSWDWSRELGSFIFFSFGSIANGILFYMIFVGINEAVIEYEFLSKYSALDHFDDETYKDKQLENKSGVK